MKVLHLIPSLSPRRGGPSVAVVGMCRALQARGVEVKIVTTNDHGSETYEMGDGQVEEREGIPVHFFAKRYRSFRRLDEFSIAPGALQWLKENLSDYDLIHSHAVFSWLPTSGMALARKAGVPYIARPLGQLCHWSMRQRTWLKRSYLSCIERANLEGARALHFTSNLEANESAAYVSPRASFVLPHGVEPATQAGSEGGAHLRARLGIDPAGVVGLFLGRIHPKKRLDLLVDAMERGPAEFHLLVAGDFDPGAGEQIRRCIDQSPLRERIHLLGHVDGEEKEACFQLADCFMLPSESENFGIAAAEAMVRGVPLVLSPHLPFSPVVREYQFGLVLDLELDAWSQALGEICSGTAWAGDTPERIRHYGKENYAWSSVAIQLIEHYRNSLV